MNNLETYREKFIRAHLDIVKQDMMQKDFIIFRQGEIDRKQNIMLLKELCRLERQVLLNSLEIAKINPSNAGYLLTGNHSKYLEVNGHLAWLFSC